MLAPIAVFVYSRLKHTKEMLESLNNNELADQSELYIFCDGPKSREIEQKVNLVKEFVSEFSQNCSFKKVNIISSDINKGLANSIIDGVSKVIKQYGKIIVLEDDLITSNDFLKFMNGALDFYEKKSNIWSISGSSLELPSLKSYNKDVYAQYRASSWGWATWEDRWTSVNWNLNEFNSYRLSSKVKKNMRKGGQDLTSMLKAQFRGKINSWAIRWVHQQCVEEKLCIYPTKTKVVNNGFDGSGMNSKKSDKNQYFFKMESTDWEPTYFEDVVPNKKLVKEFRKVYSLPLRVRVRDKIKEYSVRKK